MPLDILDHRRHRLYRRPFSSRAPRPRTSRARAGARGVGSARVPAKATPVIGDALDGKSVESALQPGDTIIHLVGTPHPNPSKAEQFEKVDLVSIRATVAAAKNAGHSHLVYVSVAQPAPVMRAYPLGAHTRSKR